MRLVVSDLPQFMRFMCLINHFIKFSLGAVMFSAKDGNNETTKVSSLTANNKNDWPQVPLVPSMSNIHCANFNNIGTANTTFNDIGYKMDQILGKSATRIVLLGNMFVCMHRFFFMLSWKYLKNQS